MYLLHLSKLYIWFDKLIKKRPVKHYRTLSTNLTKINLLTKTLLSNHYNYYPILNLSILNHIAKIILFLIHYTLSVLKSGRKRFYQTFNQLRNRAIRSALINIKNRLNIEVCFLHFICICRVYLILLYRLIK